MPVLQEQKPALGNLHELDFKRSMLPLFLPNKKRHLKEVPF